MKIECPSCHLSGKVNELELPPDGRELKCPRCKAAFHVKKPPPPAGKQDLMSMCPVCQYSTFTDEMFAVCPKCGLVGSEYRQNLRKQKENDQVRRDEDLLPRSHRNPDLVAPAQDDGRIGILQGAATDPGDSVGLRCDRRGSSFIRFERLVDLLLQGLAGGAFRAASGTDIGNQRILPARFHPMAFHPVQRLFHCNSNIFSAIKDRVAPASERVRNCRIGAGSRS